MSKRILFGKYLVLVIIGTLTGHNVFSQIIHAGIKAGYQLSWTRSDDSDFRRRTTIAPVSGYNVGAVVSFKVKDRYFLHTEYLYSIKGKYITDYTHTVGPKDEALEDKVFYHYIDVPVLYNVQFKSRLGNSREFKWYAGIGPIFSYWLGGKGTLKSGELVEYPFDHLDYKLNFGPRPDNSVHENVYINDARRFQLGFNLGGGILLEPANSKSKIMIDVRFELGHTWLGKPESADYSLPVLYDDNLRARNMGLRASVMYLIEHNLDKKVRKKGKSDFKKRRL